MRAPLTADLIVYVRRVGWRERLRRFCRRLLRLERYDGRTPETAFYSVRDAQELIATVDLNGYVATVNIAGNYLEHL